MFRRTKPIPKFSQKETHSYWRDTVNETKHNNPWEYLKPIGWVRSAFVATTIKDLFPPGTNPTILEIGSNTGRNLMMLRFAGLSPLLFGIEINQQAVDLMRSEFTMSKDFSVRVGPVEELLPKAPRGFFDVVFTMAVLEHLPPESEHVFRQMVRASRRYIFTIEDEIHNRSEYHFPRNYKHVFEKLGMKQVNMWNNVPGLGRAFKARLFIKDKPTRGGP